MLLVQTLRVPAEGVETLRRFEAAVLSLLPKYGARLERRLRSPDGRVEIHIVWFPSCDALEGYQADPRRQEHLHLLRESRAEIELLAVADVTDETSRHA